MEVAARPVTIADVAELADLAETATAELRPRRGGDVWYRSDARHGSVSDSIRADIDDPGADVAVGTIDGTIVGYGVMRLHVAHEGTKYGRVSDLYTLPGARGVGVGEAVMNHLIDRARARGCAGIESIALPGDRHTKNFFESFGLVARAILVHRSLESDGEA